MFLVPYSRIDLTKQLGIGCIFALLELLGLQLQIAGQYNSQLADQFIVIPHLAFGFALGILLCYGWHYIIGLSTGVALIFALAGTVPGISAPSFIALLPVFAAAFSLFVLRNKLKWFTGIVSIQDFFKMLGLICALPSLASPILNLLLHDGVNAPFPQIINNFMMHWMSDFIGSLLVIPCITEFRFEQKPRSKPANLLLGMVLALVILMLGQIIFFGWFEGSLQSLARPSWLLLAVVFAVLGRSVRFASILLLVVAVQVILGGIQQRGFFADDLHQNDLFNSTIFISILSSVALLVAYFLRETQLLKISMLEKIDNLHLKSVVLDAISQGVVTTDAAQNITYTNKAFRDLTQYNDQELIGHNCKLLQGEDTNPTTRKQIRLALDAQKPFGVDILNYRKNGEKFWNELNISPIFTNGKLTQFVGIQHDITWRKKAQKEGAMAKIVFEHNRNGIVVTDEATKIVSVNPTFTKITGYSAEDAIGRSPSLLSAGLHDETFYQMMWSSLNEFGYWEGEIFNKKKDGTIYLQYLTISRVLDGQQRLTNYIGMFSDLTEEKNIQNKIDFLQYSDQLTGLPNTIALQSQVQACLDNFDINGTQAVAPSAALLLLDIDYFKNINDTLDHHIGNTLLIAVAARLSGLLGPNDILSRQGGDEFTFFLPNVSVTSANEFAKNILQSFSLPFNIEGHCLNLTASIGIGMYPDDGMNLDSLLRSADIALNQVKQNGKRNFLFHTSALAQAVTEKVALEIALQTAVEKDELKLFYQAIVDVANGNIAGFEALIRWEHPSLGWVSPVRFIPLAEENGSISAIGHWVLHRACSNIRAALDAGIDMPPVAINFSPKQFKNEHLVSELQTVLTQYQLMPMHLCIEITEGVLMTDPKASKITLETLSELGFTLSLDDFGTGYSSLSYLKSFAFDKVKIDQSFVRELTAKNQDAAIVTAILNMGHSLGIKVLAEGVETEAQCEFLRDHLIDEIQGYLFSQALSWDKTIALLQEKRQLPPHLLRHPPVSRTLLLVDDEQNIVSALKRLLRRDGYEILTANSGAEGLEILSKNSIDVIISDQRMPGMTGVEFLSIVKERHPDTMRMVLSGYTELKSVTDAINEGAVFRFLTKPWDDEKLRECVKEAFQYKHFSDDNRQLSLKAQASNFELAAANRQLATIINKKQNQLAIHSQSLEIVREALRHTSVAMLGLDDTHLVAFINEAAIQLFSDTHLNFGDELRFVIPELDELIMQAKESDASEFNFHEKSFIVRWHNMGSTSNAKGKIVTISPNF